MRRIGQLEIETHAALELVLGAALITLPLALGLSGAAIILGILFGGLLSGLAVAGYEPGSRGGLSLSAHAAYDMLLAAGLVVAGIVLGLADGAEALVIFVAAGVAEATLSASTRYTARRA